MDRVTTGQDIWNFDEMAQAMKEMLATSPKIAEYIKIQQGVTDVNDWVDKQVNIARKSQPNIPEGQVIDRTVVGGSGAITDGQRDTQIAIRKASNSGGAGTTSATSKTIDDYGKELNVGNNVISGALDNGLNLESVEVRNAIRAKDNKELTIAEINALKSNPNNLRDRPATSPTESSIGVNTPFDIGTFPENSGLSPSQYSILKEESGGGRNLVNPNDQGLPSIGPQQFRGELGQQFLARFYPDLSEKYDLSKELTPGQTKDLQRDLQEKGDLVTNSLQFANDELTPRTYESYDKITGVEPREQEAVILDSMAVNHSPEGQNIILKRAEELYDSGDIGSRPEAITAARIEYVNGLDSLDDNTKLNLRERYLRELQVANNYDQIRERLGTPIRQDIRVEDELAELGLEFNQ